MKYHEIKTSNRDYLGKTSEDELVVACDALHPFEIGDLVILCPKNSYGTYETPAEIIAIGGLFTPTQKALLLRELSSDEYREWEEKYNAFVRDELDLQVRQQQCQTPADHLQLRIEMLKKRFPKK